MRRFAVALMVISVTVLTVYSSALAVIIGWDG